MHRAGLSRGHAGLKFTALVSSTRRGWVAKNSRCMWTKGVRTLEQMRLSRPSKCQRSRQIQAGRVSVILIVTNLAPGRPNWLEFPSPPTGPTCVGTAAALLVTKGMTTLGWAQIPLLAWSLEETRGADQEDACGSDELCWSQRLEKVQYRQATLRAPGSPTGYFAFLAFAGILLSVGLPCTALAKWTRAQAGQRVTPSVAKEVAEGPDSESNSSLPPPPPPITEADGPHCPRLPRPPPPPAMSQPIGGSQTLTASQGLETYDVSMLSL